MKKAGIFLLVFLLLGLMFVVQAEEADSIVYVAQNEYYNTEENIYIFPLETLGGNSIYATVANEMVVTDAVSVSSDIGIDFSLYRDGELVDNHREPQTACGSYSVCTNAGGSGMSTVMSFQIVSPSASNLYRYIMPTGFQITAVTLNDENIGVDNPFEVVFDEGVYRVTYQCTKTGQTYELCSNIDHTAPTLLLAAVNEKGVARSAVDISDVSPQDTIVLRRDGQNIDYASELTESGSYYIRITDAAGNYTEYTFRIGAYLNVAAVLFFLVILLLAGGLLAYLMKERKYVRAR